MIPHYIYNVAHSSGQSNGLPAKQPSKDAEEVPPLGRGI